MATSSRAPAQSQKSSVQKKTLGGSSTAERTGASGSVGRVEGYSAQQLMLKPSADGGYAGQSAALRPQGGLEPLDQVQTSPPVIQQKAHGPRVQSKKTGDAAKADRDLDYNTTGSGTNQRDPEQSNGELPFQEGGGWDANTIMMALTQVDDDDATLNDNKRCAAASVLGFHIQSGPAAVSAVATDVAAQMQTQVDTKPAGMSDDVHDSLRTLQPVIAAIPGRITSQEATFQDLRRLANCMKLVVDPDADSGTSVAEYANLSGLGGNDHQYLGETYTGRSQLDTMAASLTSDNRRSYGWILSVSTRAAENGTTNHAVTFGANGSGQVYLYDPWPRAGSQIMFWESDRANIVEYFQEPDGTERTWRIRELMRGVPAGG